MATLPYTATLVSLTAEDIVDVQYWCLQMWPGTLGATWNRAWAMLEFGSTYSCNWGFECREDLTMFLLTWGHLVESSQKVDIGE
jgi:hypothetical protein